MDTKKETGVTKQEVEKKYGLDKIEPNEFVKQIVKELRKYEDKLHRVANYEEMQKQGKLLNQEMLGLIGQKPEFEIHLKALKSTVNMYIKATHKPGEPEPKHEEAPVAPAKDHKAECQAHLKDFTCTAAKRVAYFLAMVSVSTHHNISQSPLTHLPEAQQKELAQAISAVTLPVDTDTSLQEVADKAHSVAMSLIEGESSVANAVDAAIHSHDVCSARFGLVAPKVQEKKPMEEPKKEVPPMAQEKVAEIKAEPKPKENVEAVKAKTEAEKPKEVPAAQPESKWANEEFGEEEEEVPAHAHEHEEPKPYQPLIPQQVHAEEGEEDFAIAGEEKKKPTRGRGRFPRRRTAGYPRYEGGAGRGDFGGQRRGGPFRGRRGEGRGDARGSRVSHQ